MTPAEQARLLLRKAAQDRAVLEKLIDDPVIEATTLGYHAQQAAEKLLKALLAVGSAVMTIPAVTISGCYSISWALLVSCCQRTFSP